VHKPESFPIDKIYVPVKRRKTLKPDVVQEIAESMLEIGQQTPIVVRPDEGRLVLVEGLHRLEACKALGEGAIIALLISADEAHEKTDPGLVAEREKMERLRKLRLEKEAAEKLANASRAASPTEAALRQREQPKATIRNNSKATSSRSGRGTQGSAPTTLSDWIKQQERNGGRY